MENQHLVVQSIYVGLLCISPVVLVIGASIAIFNKKKRKLGLRIMIAAVIILIIGFGICLNNLGM